VPKKINNEKNINNRKAFDAILRQADHAVEWEILLCDMYDRIKMSGIKNVSTLKRPYRKASMKNTYAVQI